ncbi:MAG: hypothetical protein ACRD21_21150, partial [Vicinamibacteria bacterium]
EVHVISEADLGSDDDSAPAEGSEEGVSTGASESTPQYGSSENVPESSSEEGGEEENVPEFIPPDRPLPEKLEIFEAMKRGYQRQVQDIDKSIADNERRIQEIEGDLAAASALGGAGLPVAPQTGTGTATRQMTGQESASLAGELNRLKTMNDQLRSRKEGLRLDLQAKGRAAGIPPGYLRF